ncbi:hypothetical protein ACCD09_18025 [Variovorax sp. Varisp62]|nr:hypothetical protein [Variovorax sp. Root434]
MLWCTDALFWEAKAKQCREMIFCCCAIHVRSIDHQLAAFLPEEAFGEPAWLSIEFEINFHCWSYRALAPRPQMTNHVRAMPLEEGGAYRLRDGRFARLVGCGEKIEPVRQAVDFERRAEQLEVLDA